MANTDRADSSRTLADENFKAEYGHYPIPVHLVEPATDPSTDALVAPLMRRGAPPKLESIIGRRDRE